MRLRLYGVGSAAQGAIFRIDQFPAALTLDDGGQLITRSETRMATCLLEDVGGQILIRANGAEQQVGINGAEIESGPLMPGDSLELGKQRFIVSYERTASERPPSVQVRILN